MKYLGIKSRMTVFSLALLIELVTCDTQFIVRFLFHNRDFEYNKDTALISIGI